MERGSHRGLPGVHARLDVATQTYRCIISLRRAFPRPLRSGATCRRTGGFSPRSIGLPRGRLRSRGICLYDRPSGREPHHLLALVPSQIPRCKEWAGRCGRLDVLQFGHEAWGKCGWARCTRSLPDVLQRSAQHGMHLSSCPIFPAQNSLACRSSQERLQWHWCFDNLRQRTHAHGAGARRAVLRQSRTTRPDTRLLPESRQLPQERFLTLLRRGP